jgi:hypothetical protein
MTRAWYPTPPLSDDELIRCVEAVEAEIASGAKWPMQRGENGISALQAASDTLAMSRTTLEYRIERAGHKLGRWPLGIDPGWEQRKDLSYAERKARREAREGKSGFAPVMPGFEAKAVTSQLDARGEVIRTTIRQGIAAEREFDLPEGRRIGKVTTQISADGRVEKEWIRHNTGDDPFAVIEAAKQAFEAYKGYAKIPPMPEISDADLMTVYPIADLHLGMFSWAKETGEDYDLDTARKLFAGTFGQLVERAPDSRHAVFLGLGDLFHADDTTNRTLKSGNALDVDTRYAKVFRAGVMLVRAAIEMMLSKHESVTVRILPGNHDPHSSITLAIALSQFFDGHERVIVDSDPGLFFYLRFGRNMIGATHGHAAKPKDAAGMMAASRARDWGETEWRHFLFGHFHHSAKGGEGNGIVWEIFQTIAPKDAYHAGMGYWAGRSLTALTYHREAGPHARTQVNIPSTSVRARVA